MMATFGVHSEVGKLRKVMVHRPDLSLQAADAVATTTSCCSTTCCGSSARSTSTTSSSRGCASAASRCFYVQDLLAEALAAERRGPAPADRAGRLGVHRRARPGRRGPRRAVGDARPTRSPRHLIGGLTVAESGLDLGKLADDVADRRRPRRRVACSCCRRCRTRCSPATRRAGSTAASRSTRCTGRRAGARPTTWPRSTAPTRCSPTPTSSSGTRRARRRRALQDRGLRPGVARGRRREPIGNGTVLIGMSERTPGADDRADRPGAVRQGRRRAGDRRGHDQGPRPHAPRHRVHDARPRQGDRLSRRSSRTSARSACARARSPATLHVTRGEGLHLGRGRRARRRRSCTSSRPAATPTSRSASSGTTATTSSPSSPASSSPTSATRTRSPRCARPASRSIDDRGLRARQGPRRRALHDLPARARPDLREARHGRTASAGSSPS